MLMISFRLFTPIVLVFVLISQPVEAQYPVPEGAVHPDFKLPSVEDGQPISLSDYRGQKVLLVHFASW